TSGVDMIFERGTDIASCLQKILQTTYSRWAVKYQYVDGVIIGKLIVRSVRYVTPEGVGKSYSFVQTDTGEVKEFTFIEGGVSNIKEFAFTQSADSYMPAVVVGAKIDDNSEFFTAPPTGANLAYYPFYGRF